MENKTKSYIKEYNEFVSSVKCIGKSKDKRRIQIRKGINLYEVSTYRNRLLMPFETQNDEILYNDIKGVVMENVYWLFAKELNDIENQKEQENSHKYSDNPITYTAEEWHKRTKEWIDFYTDDLKVFTDEERKYLYSNIGDDYYKNKNLYPSFFDFKEFYKLKDLKIK